MGTQKRRRFAVVGTGSRGTWMWVRPLVEEFSDRTEAVGLFDSNRERAERVNGVLNCSVPVFGTFDELVADAKPDALIVATPDATHAEYVVRGLDAGLDVYCEKPLCTTFEQVRQIRAAAERSSGRALVTHNARCLPNAEVMKKSILDGTIGSPLHVVFGEVLDRYHGADYFRRWHREFKNSGGLLLQKASHHFDLINWIIDSKPVSVTAQGDLLFYGKNGTMRGPRCSDCDHADRCEFYADVFQNSHLKALFQAAEHVDHYYRDGCVFDEVINIYDTMNVTIRYENNVLASYSLIAYASYEGMQFAVEGTEARLEWKTVYSTQWAIGREKEKEKTDASLEQSGGAEDSVKVMWRTGAVQDVTPDSKSGGHGGADPKLETFVFSPDAIDDPLGQRAGLEDGIQAALIGIAANLSIDNGGRPVDVQRCEV